MRTTHLHVKNYRGLRDLRVPMSRFACLIGENNTGKSSVLQALKLFHSGTSLSRSNYFDPESPIRIEVGFADITEHDFKRLTDAHRDRVARLAKDGCLTLVRRYDTNGKSKLLCVRSVPKDERFYEDSIADLTARERPTKAFKDKVIGVFPELNAQIGDRPSQTQVKEAIQALADSLPEDERELADAPLPTGIDKSIGALLPEPIYIPAVKDLADETKTKESSHFGKLLAILLDQIEGTLLEEQELFERLNAKLNRVQREDGTVQDDRLSELREIEKTVERYLQETFSSVTLKINIPPPEIKTILSAAQIFADDGVEGLIDTKGDGLRRAVVFSILRAYMALRRTDVTDGEEDTEPLANRYLLLFEEPELFLHPKAQLILFAALSQFANQHEVVVTTHSPYFCGPGATATFIKLHRRRDLSVAPKPFTSAHTVDLSDMRAKDEFQIICYENNNAAFFANTVVLVEGDSDFLVLPHIAKTIDPQWDIGRTSVRFVRINGKSSIRRYRAFFNRFEVRTPVIADLDLLVSGFEQIDADDRLKQMRDELIARADQIIAANGGPAEMTQGKAKRAHGSGELRARWAKARKAWQEAKEQNASIDDAVEQIDAFFAWERKDDRLAVLKEEKDPNFQRAKWQLLAKLREHDVFVLEKGTIEDYYPSEVWGGDKPTRAQHFCNSVTREQLLGLCSEQLGAAYNGCSKEFSLIFGSIFEPEDRKSREAA